MASGGKNICVLIRALKAGGAEKQSVLLTHVLKEGYQVHLVVQYGEIIEKKHLEFLLKNKIHFILLKGNLYERQTAFYRFLKEFHIQIIFSYLTSDNFWAAVTGRLAGVPYIVGGIRSIILPWHKFYVTKFLQRFFLDFMIYNSIKGYNNFIDKGFKKEKAVIIHNYIDVPPFPPERKAVDLIKIITVARFVEGKDYLTAIKTFHFLIRNIPVEQISFKYYIIGFGKLEKQIRNWINIYGLEDYIRVVLRPHDIEKYYLESDIYLCTSTEEGLSNSIMEAMSHSLPVIATDAGDNALLVRDGITGFLLRKKAYTDIAFALRKLMMNQKKRHELGSAGYDYIKEEFSREKFKKKYFELIESMDLNV